MTDPDHREHELHGALASPVPPPGAAADWTIPQKWENFTVEDHGVWDTLFERQQAMLRGRAVEGFDKGLDLLHLSRPGVPNFDELNEKLRKKTGWTVVAVPGLVPDDVFFRHLSQRQFPAGNFIRAADQLDYLEEPDVFHDVFGHVPLLSDPAVADFVETLGHRGLEAMEHDAIHHLARLYWYTIEFGLARENGQLKIYGAGILSSFSESVYSLESPVPHRRELDLRRVMRTRYRTDDLQQCYFVADGLQQLQKAVEALPLPELYDELRLLDELDPAQPGGSRLAA